LAKDTSKQRYEALFRQALRIRLVEEKIIELYPTDKIQSPVHLSIGQEAVAVGVCESLRRDDLLFSTYRGHAYYMAKGGDLKSFMAELYGRTGGFAKGKAGSMHLAAPDVGMMGSSAVVGSTIPHAVGAALAARFRKSDQVIVATFGDGATEQGSYHESLNFCAINQLPVLFLCENNGLAVHASLAERHSYSIVDHARVFGIEASRIEKGWDFLEVGDRVGEAIAAIRKDGKPRLIEVMTSRYREHVGPGEDFAAGYRPKSEIDAWKNRDPLIQDKTLAQRLLGELNDEIAAAVSFAEASPSPTRAEMLTDVD
jgi:TPP-dependent pyruvate/acetoin dehydrogenase alpha subunit